jgi:CheY-like chemotaxis protein
VVDDEVAVRDLLADVVQTLGHRVTACDSGERALQMFEPGGYDLLLTDLGMPGITGWQLARRVREQDPTVTIAFITGWGHELSPGVVRESGANALVAKPFQIEDIEELIRLASENRPDRRVA